jgi:hypothetical protein
VFSLFWDLFRFLCISSRRLESSSRGVLLQERGA